jgi:hypothetical protein
MRIEALLNTRPRLPGDCVFSGFHPGHIGLHGPVDHHPEIGGAARHVDRIGAGDQGLCRNAAGIDAGATEQAAFDDGDRRARGREPSRQRGARLPGADDNFYSPPGDWGKGWIYFCPVWPPKSLVLEEFVMDPAPAPFGGMLDPWPTPGLPMSASAVC